MRRFAEASLTNWTWNLGHILFTGLFNGLYGERLKDPFTLFKVTRRGCLSGLKVECNRFDFACERIAMLVRRGTRPIEIPVNYTSRSFAEARRSRSCATHGLTCTRS